MKDNILNNKFFNIVTQSNNEKKAPFLSKIKFEEEFKKTIEDNTNMFCNKSLSSLSKKEIYRECLNCLKDYCNTCYSLCHPHGNCSKMIGEMMNDTVFEYVSSCHCDHNSKETLNSEKHLTCFYLKFLKENYGSSDQLDHLLISSVQKKNLNIKLCENCSNCQNDPADLATAAYLSENMNFNKQICECQDPKHQKIHLIELLNIFHNEYSFHGKKIYFNEIIDKLKNELNEHFDDISDKKTKDQLIEYHSTIFTIDNIIYNENFVISLSEELSVFDFLIQKLESKDKLFFNHEKINLALTFIFYFYRKYLFSRMEMITTKNINLIGYVRRIEIKNRNYINFTRFHENEENITYKISRFTYMEKIFNYLQDYKTYSIKMSNIEKNVPFSIYFLKLFFQSYCFDKEDIHNFLNILSKMEFKKNVNHYNTILRKYIDESLFISQMYLIDLNDYKIHSDNEKKDFKHVKELFFFFNKSQSDHFKKYLGKMFSDENTYLLNSKKKNQNDKSKNNKQLEDLLKNMCQESLFYFDCFHYSFISKLFNQYMFYSSLENRKSVVISFKEIETKELRKKNLQNEVSNIIFYKNMTIPHIENSQDQKFYYNKSINKILTEFDLNLDFTKIPNASKLMGYLFYKLNWIYKKNQEFPSKIIDISKYVGETKVIDTTQINLKIFKRELKFIFYRVFNLEFYKDQEFTKNIHKWNLLLFLCLSNEHNAYFILSEINFLEFLFYKNDSPPKKSFLMRSFFNSKKVYENNFTWEFFYMLCKHFIVKNDIDNRFNYLKPLIVKNFINNLFNYFSIWYKDQNKESDNKYRDMNYPLIFYFLKITKKMLILNDLNSCYPYNFNVNKFETVEKINVIANTVFQYEFDVDKYFTTFEIFENSDYFLRPNDEIDEKNHNEENYDIGEMLNDNIERKNFVETKGSIKIENNTMQIGVVRKIQRENVQLLILDILGGLYSTTDFNVYFKILNENIKNIVYFFQNKKKYALNSSYLEKIFHCEIILLKFLLNFITVKISDYSKIDFLIETNITKEELISLGKKYCDKNVEIEPIINMKDNCLESKYFITKLKIKAFNIIGDFLRKFEKYFYDNKNQVSNKTLGLFLTNSFCLILKDYDLKSNNQSILLELQEEFFNVLNIFFEESHKMFSIISRDFLVQNENNKNNFYTQNRKDERYGKYQNEMNNIFDLLKVEEREIKFLNRLITNYFGFESQILNYLKDFILYDNRKSSKYSKLIKQFILDKESEGDGLINVFKIKKTFTENENKSGPFRRKKTYEQNNGYLVKIVDLIEKQEESDSSNFCYEIWKKINTIFSSYNSDDLEHLFKYLFNNLIILEKFEESIENINFDLIFSENFLKIINFLNNLLYYYPLNFQKTLIEQLNKSRMQVLLRNVLKLNNYIIGISEYENNEKLMSLSVIFFSLMDFFILLGEGLYDSNFEEYFFIDLFKNDDDDNKKDLNNEQTTGKTNANNSNCINNCSKKLKGIISKNFSNVNTNPRRKSMSVRQEPVNTNNNKTNRKSTRNEIIPSVTDLPTIPEDNKEFGLYQTFQNSTNIKIDNEMLKNVKKNNDNSTHKVVFDNLKNEKNNKKDMNRDFKKGQGESYIREEELFEKHEKIEIGLNNSLINMDELNDSTDFNSTFEKLVLKINKLKNEQIIQTNFRNIKTSFLKILEDFKTLNNLNNINYNYLQPDNIEYFKDFTEKYEKLFTISKNLFENLSNYNRNENFSILYGANEPKKDQNLEDGLKEIVSSLDIIIDFMKNKNNSFKDNLENDVKDIKVIYSDYFNNQEELFDILEEKISHKEFNFLRFQNLFTNNKDMIGEINLKLRNLFDVCFNKDSDVSEDLNYSQNNESCMCENNNLNSSYNFDGNNNKMGRSDQINLVSGSKNNQITVDLINNKDLSEIKEEEIKLETNNEFAMIEKSQKEANSNILLENNLNPIFFLTSKKKPTKIEKKESKAVNKNPNVSGDNTVYFEEDNNSDYGKDTENDKHDEHKNIEDNPFKDNFYYHIFVQFRNIINLINCRKYHNYYHGSNRLILQFLYLSRFLKESVEIETSNQNEFKKLIIKECFFKIFDPNWILSKNMINPDFSYILRYELTNLLNVYLEENSNPKDDVFEELITRLRENKIDSHKVFNEIVICFKEILTSFKKKRNDIDLDYERLTYESLFYIYIHNKDNFLKNKYYHLAEMYFKLLSIIDPCHQSLKEKYGDYLNIKNKKWYHVDINLHLYDSESKKIDKQDELEKKEFEENQLFYRFMKKIGREIEVRFEEFDNQFVYRKIFFFKNPKCFWINNLMRMRFLEKTPRATLGEKLDYLNRKIDKFLLNINASYINRPLNTFNWGKHNRKSSFTNLDVINFILVLILNILLLVYFYEDASVNSFKNDLMSQMFLYQQSQKIESKFNYIFFTTIGFSLLQLGLLIYWYHFRYNVRLVLAGYKRIPNGKYIIKNDFEEKKFKSESFNAYISMKNDFDDEKSKYLTMKFFDLKSFLMIFYLRLKIILWNRDIVYIVYSLIFNVLYLITNYKLLLVIPIISIMNLYALFKYFYEAMISKYKEFVALLIFIYFVEYIFSWLSFLHFQEFMISEHFERNGNLNENDSKKELLCSTAIECFLNYVDMGLRLGGGMGDSSARVSFKYQEKRDYFSKLFLDVAFHIIVNLILGNIFFGVIVDTFNDLRDKRDAKTIDENNKCFMCDRDRYDNHNIDFDFHRNSQHNIFNYIYFIPYLLKKNPQEYTRGELYAWEQINLRKLDWFPSPPPSNNEKETN